ncbi:MAG: phytoene desaturase [Spirochaetia bacterium]|nr:phytoene desaturase [Spirochaetia bacterium]
MKTNTAIVIGSGFGGLATAIRLQKSGASVTLLEAREKTGGRAYQFQEKGYTFDMGPSLITAPEIIRELFSFAGKSLEAELPLIPLDPFYRVYFHDGTYFDHSGNLEHIKAQLRVWDPRDADRFDSFMRDTKPLYEAVIENGLGAEPFDKLAANLKFLPTLLRLGGLRNHAGFAARYFRDARSRFLFSFHPLFIGGNPFRVPAIYQMIPYLEIHGGVLYTRGGMYSLIKAMEKIFLELGGVLKTSTPVEEILLEKRKAVGVRANGQAFRSDLVVSNADLGTTYRHLLPESSRKKWTNRRVEKIDYSMSAFLVYLGVRKKYDKLRHHTIILSPRYRELLRDIFDRKILAEDFSLYLHVPSRTDDAMAPPGCESIYALAPVPNLKGPTDWKNVREPFAEKIISYLEDWGLPDLRKNLEVRKIFSPEDFKTDLRSMAGNAFGIHPTLTQTAYFRPHNRSEDIEHLYFTGAGTHPGAGLPGTLLSARAAMVSILEDFDLKKHAS